MSTAVRDSLIAVGLVLMLLYFNPATAASGAVDRTGNRADAAHIRPPFARLNVENQVMLGEMTRSMQEVHEGRRVVKIYEGAYLRLPGFPALQESQGAIFFDPI